MQKVGDKFEELFIRFVTFKGTIKTSPPSSSHFEDSQYMCPKDRHTSSRVLPTAVPTIVNAPHPPTKPTPRSRPDIDSGPPKTPRVTTDPPSISSAPTCTVSSPRLVRKFRNLQSALSKSRRTVERRRFAKSIRQAGTSNFDVAKLPEKVRCFFAAQLKAVEVNRSGMRWSRQIIEMALGIKFRSTAAYKFLISQGFALPSVRTLQRSIEDVCVYSGPCLTLTDLMDKKLNAMKPDDRMATLSLDAMKISPVIRYDESKDFIKGYEEAGSFGRSPKVADEGMAVMVRGVRSHWKQLIGYYLIRHSVKQERFLQIIFDCLRKCCEVGLKIICIVCDQETTQFVSIRNQGVTPHYPYLINPVMENLSTL